METSKLKKFAQYARRSLIEQVGSKLAQVIKEESAESRELPNVVAKLESELKQKGKEQLVEQAAYTWFNRFCALRFMDVNQYNRIMVLSPLEGQFQPEILAEAKAGHIDDSVVNDKTKEKIFSLLNGSIKSRDGQSEAYRLLIVAVCNDYHRIMPYLFERIEDYMELLMPDDLLSGNSILAYTREAMTLEACESVECIGWLYQFYISEKKDQVFEGLKKNKKITPENIPAATQLFTPDWIVRYLVENSLGRLWMLNNPSSKVIEQMDYYIKPVEEESDFLKIRSPEEIKVCDPACGSGHMLTYAYDLLYAIYLDAEYDPVDIPELILTKNLYGIEIDERAAELAAFALSMKAIKGDPNTEGNNRRRFFRNPIKPNICLLENITFNDTELDEYFNFVGRDLFTQDLRTTLKEFEEADNFGSLIQPTLKNAADVLSVLEAKDVSGQLFLAETHQRVLRAIDQSDYLSQKYHIVVANPPYMGGNGMNTKLSAYLNRNYSETKSDLFSAFMVRNLTLALNKSFIAMITMQSWMFLSSYEKFRERLLRDKYISSMVHIGPRGFDSIGGEVVSTTAFVIGNHPRNKLGSYIQTTSGRSEREKEELFLKAIRGEASGLLFNTYDSIYSSIPGKPISYWVPSKIVELYRNGLLGSFYDAKEGVGTRNDDVFMKMTWEVSRSNIGKNKRWVYTDKAGEARRWYLGATFLMDWEDDGQRIKNYRNEDGSLRSRPQNIQFLFKEGVTWGKVGTAAPAFRWRSEGYAFNDAAPTIFGEDSFDLLGQLNSVVMREVIKLKGDTMNLTTGIISELPLIKLDSTTLERSRKISKELVAISKSDWDEYEVSESFRLSPLLDSRYYGEKLKKICHQLIASSKDRANKAQSLEVENNKIFASFLGMSDHFNVEVEIKEISLNCNISYRYSKADEKVRESLYLTDILKDYLSYAVACMFGRYSLDTEGIILANQNDTLEEYLKQVPQPSFLPENDNVIPIIDFEGDWFEDDISERFKEFLKLTFGEEHFAENLAFVEEIIGKDIKKYFVKDFYTDHVKRYKKRPIYWLFSSPKGTFNALIYMHRYRSDTVSVVLNDYLREFRTKLQARKESYEQVGISVSASPKDKNDAIKAIDKINMALDEVNGYERDILYPLAGQKIEIDLDNGVKANYPQFGKALKNITGLS